MHAAASLRLLPPHTRSQEARALLKARKLGVLAPLPLHVDTQASVLYMTFVPGLSVKQRLFEVPAAAELSALAAEIGRAVARLHDGSVVHGDLTTSNMVVRQADGALVLIDFGLSYTTSLPEDKAVDLYVLERAITSAHSDLVGLVRRTASLLQLLLPVSFPVTQFEEILQAYKRASKNSGAILSKYADGARAQSALFRPHSPRSPALLFPAVRMRGRKRSMVG